MGFTLRVLVLASPNPRRLKPAPLKKRPGLFASPGRFLIRNNYWPISRITNDPGIGVGRGFGFSGVGAPAGLKSAVSV